MMSVAQFKPCRYSGVYVRHTPGGKIIGVLRPGVKFYLTGKTARPSLEWVEGVGSGESARMGWVAKTWLDIQELEPQRPGPVYVPRETEIPADYSDRLLFRNWQEALWQIALGAAVFAAFYYLYQL